MPLSCQRFPASVGPTKVKRVRSTVLETRNHRLHKIVCLLPAGRVFVAKIDQTLMQHAADSDARDGLSKLVDRIPQTPLFVTKPLTGVQLLNVKSRLLLAHRVY